MNDTNENKSADEPTSAGNTNEAAIPAAATNESGSVEGPIPAIRSNLLMSKDSVALLVIDVQEKLVPHIQDNTAVLWNIRRLIDAAAVLNISTLCTEQYPKGLGSTVPLISDRIQADDEKILFSCRDCQKVIERLRKEGRQQVLLCGIESHVCVQQTALDLLSMGFEVFIAIDAIGSRFSLDHETAIQRMQSAGVSITTTESAMFEWCEVSGTHEFKRISSFVREQAPEVADVPDARFFPRPGARYVVQNDHSEQERTSEFVNMRLRFVVRDTTTGKSIKEYNGTARYQVNDWSHVLEKTGTQAVEISSDGTAVNVMENDDQISVVYLPVGDARTNHPLWKIKRFEHLVTSADEKSEYRVTFQVVNYRTESTFREFEGYEHRATQTEEIVHVSGVRHLEVSTDGRWLVVTELGRAPQIIELPKG